MSQKWVKLDDSFDFRQYVLETAPEYKDEGHPNQLSSQVYDRMRKVHLHCARLVVSSHPLSKGAACIVKAVPTWSYHIHSFITVPSPDATSIQQKLFAALSFVDGIDGVYKSELKKLPKVEATPDNWPDWTSAEWKDALSNSVRQSWDRGCYCSPSDVSEQLRDVTELFDNIERTCREAVPDVLYQTKGSGMFLRLLEVLPGWRKSFNELYEEAELLGSWVCYSTLAFLQEITSMMASDYTRMCKSLSAQDRKAAAEQIGWQTGNKYVRVQDADVSGPESVEGPKAAVGPQASKSAGVEDTTDTDMPEQLSDGVQASSDLNTEERVAISGLRNMGGLGQDKEEVVSRMLTRGTKRVAEDILSLSRA